MACRKLGYMLNYFQILTNINAMPIWWENRYSVVINHVQVTES